MRPHHLSLIAMSAIFFYLPLFIVQSTGLGFLAGATGLDLLYPLSNFSFPALISLCGGIVYLRNTREENPLWCLGIPLCVMFAITTVSPVVSGFLVIRGMEPPIYDPGVLWNILSQLALALLPPCAALFFWSQKELGRWMLVFLCLSLVVTLGSLAMFWAEFSPYLVSAGLIPPEQPLIVNGLPVRSENDGFLMLTLMFGLPLIGILFLILAAISWDAARNSSDRTAGHPVPRL